MKKKISFDEVGKHTLPQLYLKHVKNLLSKKLAQKIILRKEYHIDKKIYYLI